MDDIISRQAALDALEWKWAGKAAMDAIKNLPSAQPEFDSGLYVDGFNDGYKQGKIDAQPEIICCKDCKYNYGLTHNGEFNPDDIVCTFFDTDGMQCCDFCSYAERVNNELV